MVEIVNAKAARTWIATDLSRAGMYEKSIRFLLDPAAPARDLALPAEKYRVLKMRPAGMFPHTHHIENVALLEIWG